MRFTGYAAVFDAVDRGGDVIRRGAFAEARAPVLLWQHRGSAVGAIEALAEDARGLKVTGSIEDARLGALVAAGAVAGLSVGYRVVAQRQGAWRELLTLELIEVSLVAQPMQRLARVTQVF